jgi:cytosine/adenosine deaminase-related metal-dependent hydrolase
MFTEMRCGFAQERWKSNDAVWGSDEPFPEDGLRARDMLAMATLDGAHVLGLEDRIGSLTPGKQADVVVIDGKAPNTAPVIDPVATVVLAADTSNVDTVIIAGRIQKRNGQLLADWGSALAKLQTSSDHLRDALAKRRAEQEAS